MFQQLKQILDLWIAGCRSWFARTVIYSLCQTHPTHSDPTHNPASLAGVCYICCCKSWRFSCGVLSVCFSVFCHISNSLRDGSSIQTDTLAQFDSVCSAAAALSLTNLRSEWGSSSAVSSLTTKPACVTLSPSERGLMRATRWANFTREHFSLQLVQLSRVFSVNVHYVVCRIREGIEQSRQELPCWLWFLFLPGCSWNIHGARTWHSLSLLSKVWVAVLEHTTQGPRH